MKKESKRDREKIFYPTKNNKKKQSTTTTTISISLDVENKNDPLCSLAMSTHTHTHIGFFNDWDSTLIDWHAHTYINESFIYI